MYLNGRRYTWSNERENATLEKIDHVFATVSWEESYPSCFLSALGTVVSDHCPLLLDLNADFRMGKRFKLEAFWTKKEDFREVVADGWGTIPAMGNPFKALDTKLRATAKRLQQWSDRWIGNIKLQIGIALEVIQRLDVAAESRDLSTSEMALRRLLKKKLLGLSSLERSIARQRSRMLWLRDGDASTQFFHLHACHRRWRNTITTLKCGERILSGHEEIVAVADAYYMEVLGSAPVREYGLDLAELGYRRGTCPHLDMPFSAEEVLKVIKSMPLDKAPGPDGFTGRFYYVCWDIIREDFMCALHAFHCGDMRGMHAINKALITLIPKVDGAVDIRDFRPLSLVHGAIKIFAKTLLVRLSDDLPELVGIHQSAYVRGRSIHDNFMMVQCMARRLHGLKMSAIMLKLDISKVSILFNGRS